MKTVVLGNCTEWLTYCLYDIRNMPNIKLINTIYPCENRFLMKIAQVHFSQKINSKIKIPFKSIWFHYFCKNICKSRDEKLIIVFYDWNRLSNNKKFLTYLRKYFGGVKLVYVFTNIIEKTYAYKNNFVDDLNKYYDLIYAFDKKDSQKYGFLLTQLLYSYIDVGTVSPTNKVFFAGSAKDRLQCLLKSYDEFKKIGIPCNFHILNVPKEDIVEKEGIEYNRPIHYNEVVKETQESSCIVEFKQGNSSAFTIKVCEAIYYDKILITTNHDILNAPFYDERFMFVIDNPSDINIGFFKYKDCVKYTEAAKDYFSVQRFFDDINKRIIEKEE